MTTASLLVDMRPGQLSKIHNYLIKNTLQLLYSDANDSKS